MRVQVNISDKTVKRVDELAKEIGVSRSALCSMVIYKSLPTLGDWRERELFKYWIEETEHEQMDK